MIYCTHTFFIIIFTEIRVYFFSISVICNYVYKYVILESSDV